MGGLVEMTVKGRSGRADDSEGEKWAGRDDSEGEKWAGR